MTNWTIIKALYNVNELQSIFNYRMDVTFELTSLPSQGNDLFWQLKLWRLEHGNPEGFFDND